MISINAQILPVTQTEANLKAKLTIGELSEAECMVELSDTELGSVFGGATTWNTLWASGYVGSDGHGTSSWPGGSTSW